MRARLCGVLLVLLVLLAGNVCADEVEVIALRFRTVDQVAPVLRPMVDPGGALTGMQSTLVIRSSRRNIEDIKRVLASLDQPPRRLLISVRQDTGVASEAQGGSVGGRVVIGEGNRQGDVAARVYSSRSARDERVSQQVQTLDGSPAMIQIGQSVPIRTQSVGRTYGGGAVITDNITYRDVTTGFSVVPRLAGEQVTLEISPQREALTGSGGAPGSPPVISAQRIVSSVSGRLGEWIDIGGMTQDDRRDERSILSSASAARQDNRRVWVRVDALP